jgi:2-polyprenyl-3-methyl-5-hydroxy-6-metoxy-1,4-benzoquinol methylase
MDKGELYDTMAERKYKPRDMQPYDGNNGRVNRCVQFMRAGKIRTGGTLLDVGGGIGDLGYATRDLFERRIVVDISDKNLQAARTKGNEILVGDVDIEGFRTLTPYSSTCQTIEDNSVDVVCALDFIEHIVDPENFARECRRVLKPSGEVFINTPNIRFWRHIDQLWKTGKFPHTSGDREVYHGGHLAFYTYSDLREIFEPAGFVSVLQLKDEEGYESPPNMWISAFTPRNQDEYMRLSLEFGCPNMLYKAVVTK